MAWVEPLEACSNNVPMYETFQWFIVDKDLKNLLGKIKFFCWAPQSQYFLSLSFRHDCHFLFISTPLESRNKGQVLQRSQVVSSNLHMANIRIALWNTQSSSSRSLQGVKIQIQILQDCKLAPNGDALMVATWNSLPNHQNLIIHFETYKWLNETCRAWRSG